MQEPVEAPPTLTPIQRNKQLVDWEIAEGVIELRSFPYDIQFSPDHRCNLRCVMCWSTVARNQGNVPLKDRRLPEKTLERFLKLKPYFPYFETMALTGSGEPLIQPDFPKMLDALSGSEMFVVLTTHGNFIDRKMAETMVKKNVGQVTLSLDGATKETYEKIRVRATWEKLMAAVDVLNQTKRDLGSASPKIAFAGNFMRQNIEELPDLIDFAAAKGAYMVVATNTLIYDPEMEQQALVNHPEVTRASVIEAVRRAHRLGILFDNRVLDDVPDVSELEPLESDPSAVPPPWVEPTPKECDPTEKTDAAVVRPIIERPDRMPGIPEPIVDDEPAQSPPVDLTWIPQLPEEIPPPPEGKEVSDILKACQMPWKGIMVESDGNVKNCCYDAPYVGNLNEQSLEEIWNGEPLKALRRSFVEGRPPEGCKNCFIFLSSQKDKEMFFQKIPSRRANVDSPQDNDVLEGDATIHGWAVDAAGVKRVEIFIDGRRVGEASYGGLRPDVAKVFRKYVDSLKSGFSYRLDTRKFKSGYHLLSLSVTNMDDETVEYAYRTIKLRND